VAGAELSVSIALEDDASPVAQERIRRACAAVGLEAAFEPRWERRSAPGGPELPWIISIAVGVPLAHFFGGFFGAAGKDSWEVVKGWIRELRAARGARRGTITLRSSDGTDVRIGSSLPDEALDALRDVDWSQQIGADLTWDAEAGRWRDAR
jgi:hypothetical protein